MSGCLEPETGVETDSNEQEGTSRDDGQALKLGYTDGFTTA